MESRGQVYGVARLWSSLWSRPAQDLRRGQCTAKHSRNQRALFSTTVFRCALAAPPPAALERSEWIWHFRRASSSKGCVGHARTTSAGSQGRMTCPWDWEPRSAGGEPSLRPRCPGAGCPRRGAGAHALRAFVGTGQPVGWRGASGYMSGALGLLNHWLDSDDVRCARATVRARATRFQPRTCRTTSSGPMGQSLWHGALGSTPNDPCCCAGLPGSTMRRGRGIASVKSVVRNRSRSQRIAI
jgi:hypothetical protein